MDASATDKTERKQSGLIPFKPGQSGNPAGRPKGARAKLGEAFIDALLADWNAEGVAAIKAMREEKAADYVKVVAAILPKELSLDEDTTDALADVIMARRKKIAE